MIVNPRASRLADPERRAQIVEAVVARGPSIGSASRRGSRTGALEAARAALAVDPGRAARRRVGGDGTVREAAAALIGRETPLAIVPAGTATSWPARSASAACARASTPSGPVERGDSTSGGRDGGRSTAIGRGEANAQERIFTVACGMGLDARIMAAAEHEWKRRLRFGAYVGAAVRELARLEPARFRIVADGETIEIVGHLVLVANAGELVPGRIGPRQPIDPTDGRLDLIVLGGDRRASGRCTVRPP